MYIYIYTYYVYYMLYMYSCPDAARATLMRPTLRDTGESLMVLPAGYWAALLLWL